MAATVTSESLEQLFEKMNTGPLNRAILNNLKGINHRQIPGMLPTNKELPGLTFFTRPQLNMQSDNLRNVRKLSQLLSDNPISIQRYIRAMLDPRLLNGVHDIAPLRCPIIDNKQAFIPFFTNNYLSQSGWPSISVPSFTSKAGLYNESISMVDGRVLNNETWDLNVNFRNLRGDLVLLTLYVWALYMSYVFEGKLVPYLDFISENEIDYNTRIYRIVLDYRRRTVTKISACHAAYPVGVPIGDAFNDPGNQTYSQANQEISVSFRCMGVDYFDDILVKEFNTTVAIFNPSMEDSVRDSQMMLIPQSIMGMFNHHGYPYINPKTSELEWYISMEDYHNNTKAMLDAIEANDTEETGE